MLKCKANFRRFKDTEFFDYTMLGDLCSTLILHDPVNFNINGVGQGFPEAHARMIADKIDGAEKDSSILIFNNFSLILYDMLREKGYNNIYICYHDFSSETGSQIVYNIMRDYISANFGEAEDILSRVVSYGEILGMSKKFDFIVSNPPYKIGNEITRAIIDNVEFDTMVNLMPTKCYKSNLFQHVQPGSIQYVESTTDFDAAYVTPVIAALKKEKCNLSENFVQFEVNEIYDQRLSKFWQQQLLRKPSFLMHNVIVHQEDFANISSKTSFSCGIYTPSILRSNGPKTLKNKDGSFKTDDRHYIWNFLKPDEPISNYFEATNGGTCINQTVTTFATEQEADNFKAWAHSGELSGKGRLQGLFSILLRAMNKPTGCPFPYAIPYVDWTHPWTDEEILRDYGYTEEETADILTFNDDLKVR